MILNENKSLVKIYTMRHFVTEKVLRRTIYAILDEHFTAQKANESGKIPKKCPKDKLMSLNGH